MDAAAIGELAFKSVPASLKGTVTFTREVQGAYDPITGVFAPGSTLTASAEAVVQAAKGTGSETFVDLLAIRQKYLRLTVRASQLDGFYPQAGDTATVAGETFRVVGCEAVSPNGSSVAVYNVTVER